MGDIQIQLQRVQIDKARMRRAAQTASFTSVSHAAAAIRLTARRSIRRSSKPSSPGMPPHTRKGKLREAIIYSVDRNAGVAVIGPAYSQIAAIGGMHERGATEVIRLNNWNIRRGGHGPIFYAGGELRFAKLLTARQVTRAQIMADQYDRENPPKSRTYPKRPFMGPALEALRPRLAGFWANSVH